MDFRQGRLWTRRGVFLVRLVLCTVPKYLEISVASGCNHCNHTKRRHAFVPLYAIDPPSPPFFSFFFSSNDHARDLLWYSSSTGGLILVYNWLSLNFFASRWDIPGRGILLNRTRVPALVNFISSEQLSILCILECIKPIWKEIIWVCYRGR